MVAAPPEFGWGVLDTSPLQALRREAEEDVDLMERQYPAHRQSAPHAPRRFWQRRGSLAGAVAAVVLVCAVGAFVARTAASPRPAGATIDGFIREEGGECAKTFQDNCAALPVPCCDKFTTCFEKSDGHAYCRPTCALGAPDEAPPWDIEADLKPWTCRIIEPPGKDSSPAPAPTPAPAPAPAPASVPAALPGLPGVPAAPVVPMAVPVAPMVPMAPPAIPAGLLGGPAAPSPPAPQPATKEPEPTPAPAPQPVSGPSMYCFLVALVRGNEPELLRRQMASKTGVFGCDTYSIFSERAMVLGHGSDGLVKSTEIGGPMSTVKENTADFLRAYSKLIEAGHHKVHEWTIKVDPDTMLIPDRLRTKLGKKEVDTATEAVYFRNCAKYDSLQGPLEILSQAAAVKVFDSLEECKSSKKINQKGEDWFMGHCLEALGVKGVEDFDLLDDRYCTERAPDKQCQEDKAAFHPFKTTESYTLCLEHASKEDNKKA
mmetsp:Transcript_70672/g.204892  ORF Transcript_70672/g.204892 Transcript_70672/m.204892 type:complete len:488 (-) Transcript_70672:258-1721(-)